MAFEGSNISESEINEVIGDSTAGSENADMRGASVVADECAFLKSRNGKPLMTLPI
jgi:hypothetical protein